jgi:cytochrome c oxidase subunit 2
MKVSLRYVLPGILLSIFFILVGCTKAPATPSTFPATSGGPTTSPGITRSPTVSTTSTVTSIPSGSPSISNGERIYTTSTSDSGERITYTGGPGMMMQGVLACVNCHGPEGRGGIVYFMMQSFDIPNITWPELTGPHMDHPPYTEETLKRAVTQGLDPAGEPLEYPMPRWQMSGSDLNDLAAYIKTLK